MWRRNDRTEYRRFLLESPLISVLSSLVLGLLLAASAGAQADPQQRVVRLSDAEGSVQILRGNETEFQQAYTNMPLIEGSRLQTGEDGRAEIQFEDGGVARLTPNSSLSLDRLSRDGSGAAVDRLQVMSGLVYFEAGADPAQQYTILFGQNSITPDGASTFRINADTNPPELVVLQGSVQAVNGSAYSVSVKEGETVRFDPSDARYFLGQGYSDESWDQWNIDRDQTLTSMAAQQTEQARNGVDQGGQTGWNDLDYYGNWYSVAGYGNVWAPGGVDAGWDPYGSGYWAFYPGTGYVWISSNPWGWLPYRCGAWNYFGGFGWGWIPGGCGGGWGADVAIWDAPAGYYRPQRPHPVGPRDNLPSHGRVIAVNRGPIFPGGGTGTNGGTPRVGANGGRPLFAGGTTFRPLPKVIHAQTGVATTGLNPSAPIGRTAYDQQLRSGGGPRYATPGAAVAGRPSYGTPGNMVRPQPAPGQGYRTGPVYQPGPAPRYVAPPAPGAASRSPAPRSESAPRSEPRASAPEPRSAPASAPAPKSK